MTFQNFVKKKMATTDKTAESQGYPLKLENCKKYKNMRQLEIYGNSFQDGTPSPDNSIEVKSVGEKSVNEVDIPDLNETITNYYYVPYNNTEGYYTKLVLKPNTTYYVRFKYVINSATQEIFSSVGYGGDNYRADIKSYKLVSQEVGKETIMEYSFTTPTSFVSSYGTPYLWFRFTRLDVVGSYNVDISDIYVGSAPYGKYKISVVQRGKNLLKPTKVSAQGISTTFTTTNSYGTTIDSTDLSDNRVVITQTKYPSTSNREHYTNGYFTILTEGLVVGRKYVISFDIKVLENPLNTSYLGIYSSGMYDSRAGISQNKQRVKATFIHKLREGNYKPYLEIRNCGMSLIASNFMITEVDEDIEFEPYVEPITTNVFLNEPLRKVGNYADYIDFKNCKIVRNTYLRVYNGIHDNNNPFGIYDDETNWGGMDTNRAYETENGFCFTLNDVLPVYSKYGHVDFSAKPICLQLPVISRYFSDLEISTVSKEQIVYNSTARNVMLFLSKDRVGESGTRQDILNYLKNNPISVLCAIYQPYEEPLDIELPKLNAKTTIIEVGTELAPSNICGKYIKR